MLAERTGCPQVVVETFVNNSLVVIVQPFIELVVDHHGIFQEALGSNGFSCQLHQFHKFLTVIDIAVLVTATVIG